tara:strand:+ start:626 stop:1825 length:1200 start_codon:yes stop_codon:yes gene_type:complete
MKKKANIIYVRNFISLIIITSFLKEQANKSIKNVLILPKQYFSKKTFIFCKSFFERYFEKVFLINYIKKPIYNPPTNRIDKFYFKLKVNFFDYLYYSYQRSKNIDRLSVIIKDIILNYKVINIYSGGDDIELAIQKITKTKSSLYWIEHGIGNLTSDMFLKKKSLKNSFFILLSSLLFKFRILFYSNVNWEGYITVLGHKINNRFLKKNFKNLKSEGFSPLIKKICVKLENVNIIMNELINFYKLKRPKTLKNFVFLDFSADPKPKNINKMKQNMNLISSLINKKDDIILLKVKNHAKYKNSGFQKILISNLKKNNFKIISLSEYPLKIFPVELIIKLFKIKKTISYDTSAIFFSNILFTKISNHVFYSHLSKNKNVPKAWSNTIDVLKKGFKKEVNFY